MRVTVQHSAYNAHLGAAGSEIIPEDKRASIMNIFRIPLNAIVVIALLNIKSMTNSQVRSLARSARPCAVQSAHWSRVVGQAVVSAYSADGLSRCPVSTALAAHRIGRCRHTPAAPSAGTVQSTESTL